MSVLVNISNGVTILVSQESGTSVVLTSERSSLSVTSESKPPISISGAGPVGPQGIQGETGPQGPAGADGSDGVGVPAGGTDYQILRKASGTDYDTEWDYADRINIEVRFDEAVSKGDPLYITGFNSGQNRVTVAKADASDSGKMPSIGLAYDDYSQNDNGQATTIGNLDDVNTQVSPNDFQEDDVLYVKAGGGLTNVKPTGTNLIQNVGKVSRRQQNNGEIVVMAIGRSNDVPNLPAGKFFIGSATNTTESDYTLPTSDGSANQVLQTNGAGAVSFQSIIQATGNELEDVSDDTSPSLGGDLITNSFGNYKIITKTGTNGDIRIEPDGTGLVGLGSWDLRTYQTLGAPEDGYVLTYNNSSGSASFAAASGGGSNSVVIASQTAQVRLNVNDNYYTGNDDYGWAYPIWLNPTSFSTSFTDFYALMGIIIPKDLTTLDFLSTLSRSNGNGTDATVELFVTDRPNGSTANMTLTSIGSASAGAFSTGVVYNVDIELTGLSLTKGQLLFVALKKTGGTNTTTYAQFNFTIIGS